MTFRWFGSKYDRITLEQIRQIPGVTGIVTTLYGTAPGEVWKTKEIKAIKKEIEEAGLKLIAIESVNIHDSIKIGSPDREQYIDNYIETLEHIGQEDIKIICYNFMPIFDWTRSDLAKVRTDGSTVLAYDQKEIDKINPTDMFETMNKKSNGFELPGWEPERMGKMKELFELYKDVDEEKLFSNLVYFLKRIHSVCEKYGIRMAIHPDDPAWPVFNLPRIVTNKEQILRLMKAVDAPFNGVTLCTGSLGSNPDNNIPDIIRSLKGRIPFAHIRNLQYNAPGNFQEAAHLSSDGSLDMYEIMRTLYEIGFDGIIRPDHGRTIWGELAMPGYGLYDRALGAVYLQGLWEAIEKNASEKYKLEHDQISLVGVGGGAAALIVYFANKMKLKYSIPENAEVISSIGVALSMVRDVVERIIPSPTKEDIRAIKNEVLNKAIESGAVSGSVEIHIEIDSQTSKVTAIAIGSTEVKTTDLSKECDEKEACELAALDMRLDLQETELIEKTDYFFVYGQKTSTGTALPIRIVDKKGFIKVQSGNAMCIKTKVKDYLEAVKALWEDMAVYKSEVIVRPDFYLCIGARVMDFSAFVFSQLELLIDLEISSMEPESDVIVVAANAKQN